MVRYEAIIVLFEMLINRMPVGFANPDREAMKSVAHAIDHVSVSEQEAEILARVAWWESGLRRDVIHCTTVNKFGARGVFQVVPRNHVDSLDACSSNFEIQARLALIRVRESRATCERAGMRGSDTLSVYTTGKCQRGERLASVRYGDGSVLLSIMNR
jgi:hypothetical protein